MSTYSPISGLKKLQPRRRCRSSDRALYWVRTRTRRRPELMQLESVKSMIRYRQPNGTAGDAAGGGDEGQRCAGRDEQSRLAVIDQGGQPRPARGHQRSSGGQRLQDDLVPAIGPARHPDDRRTVQKCACVRAVWEEVNPPTAVTDRTREALQSRNGRPIADDEQVQVGVDIAEHVERPDSVAKAVARPDRADAENDASVGDVGGE